ncbi:DUF943 family protein [Erwinia tracheiphila]|nr:DUF943 family protein [Erwinia tracheiphila]
MDIVATHQKFETSSVLVNHFPLTDSGKIQ